MTEQQRREPPAVDGNGGPPAPVPLGAVLRSVLAAAFGVQSARNKERDFSQGNYRHFIIGGIVFTVLFVLTLVLVVRLVLASR
jgi:hypothetical protein